ncbi:MAG: YdiU family protein [Magnetococcales bacterium]|nr:YdiU family protein [Magnetococcales bacterium]MBF0321594.1 YdiU family protein [Magnetococcales bacterium]
MCITGWKFANSYARLPEVMFTRLRPTVVNSPELVILNHALLEELGLRVAGSDDAACAQLFSGNRLPEGSEPLAQAYAGHQFGHFTMLGDGRAIVLGEHVTPSGKRVDIQFKGSGRTPYSRNGDGKAALGPMLREYIISEAMHGLGIPTTRSLAVVTTGEPVLRETVLPGAILTRVASSHLRVGTFQYLAMRRDVETLRVMVHHTIHRHYPDLATEENPPLALLRGVMQRQIDLVVDWMRVGFVHGVMNTDNVTLSGETIDYGPCAFMDIYDPTTVFSSIDHHGRYAFGNQPPILQWNLARFAETLLPLLHDDHGKAVTLAEEVIHGSADLFAARWHAMMCAKLGIAGEDAEDTSLVANLLAWMRENRIDYTRTFRFLSIDSPPAEEIFQQRAFKEWHKKWQARLEREPLSRTASLELRRTRNPAIIPRNHKVEEALNTASEKGDLLLVKKLLEALSSPYDDHPELIPYQTLPEADNRVYQTFCGT